MAGRYKPYPEYKNSGIEWLGGIPLSWNCVRLKYSADLHSNKIEAGSVQRYIGMENIESGNGRYLAKEDVSPEGLSTSFLKGDVLFGKLRPYLAKSWLAEFSGICSSEFLVLRSKNVSPGFLHYYTLTDEFINQVNASTYGSKMPRASWDFIGLLPVPIPDNGSGKISNFLDHETAKIDTLIEKQQQLIQLLKEKRQAVISHAVTKGLNPNVKMRDSGVEWLGVVPEHWYVVPLKRVCEVKDGTHETPQYVDMSEDAFPLITSKDFIGDSISFEGAKYISKVDHLEIIKRSNTETGDVLMSMIGGNIGKAALVKSNANFSIKNVALFKTHGNQHVAQYILYYLQSGLLDIQISLLSRGGAQGFLSLGDIRNLCFLKAPSDEIEEIVESLSKSTIKFDHLIEKAELAVKLIIERRTALISAAVTGKMDVRDWVAPKVSQTNKEVAA